MAGAHVFPGGTVDPEDRDPAILARCIGQEAEEAAARMGEPEDPAGALAFHVAAVRETFEEAGVLLAEGAERHGRDVLSEARDDLNAGRRSFVAIAEALDLRLRLDALAAQARWITPIVEARRYDTRFFIARAPDAQDASHDAKETTESAWMTPAGALEAAAKGTIQLPPPTLVTLGWLADRPNVDDAFAAARARVPPRVMPAFRREGKTLVLALPGDPAHPIATPAFEGVTRVVLEDGRWWAR